MDDSLGKIKVIRDHFQPSSPDQDIRQPSTPTQDIHQPSTPTQDIRQNNIASGSQPRSSASSRSYSRSWAQRKLRSAAFVLNMFSVRGMPWSSSDGQEKVELTVAEVESLRSELADLEEREALLKARLEHIDQILQSARLSGYLYIRTRWTALPGEPLPLDDTDVDDWLPRFVVLQGPCIFFYLLSTDLGPQDSTLLSDIVEIGRLPNITREDGETWYAFHMLTRQGLRYECSSISKIQVDSWLLALQTDCELKCDTTLPDN